MEKRILIALIIGLSHIASVWATPQKTNNSLDKTSSLDPTKAKIMKQINKVNDDGSYTFGYESDDGSFRVETRNKDGVVKGKYGFLDPGTGELKVTEYTAGEKAAESSDPQSDEYQENYRPRPRPTASSDQSVAAQTPSANKIARPAAPNNSFDDEIDVDDGPKQYKFNSGSPAPAPATGSPTDDEDYRSFGTGAQQAYQQRRQIESRQGELSRGQGPTAGPPPGPPSQFFSPQDARQFGGDRPRYIPTSDFNDFQNIQQQGGPQYQGGPSPFGGSSQQFPQGFNAGPGPQQFNAPVLRSPQQSPQGQGQFEIQNFGRPQPGQSLRGGPEGLSPFSAGPGRFDEPTQRLSFGAGQGPSPFQGFEGQGPSSNGRQFAAGPAPRGREPYTPNYELDGYSEDADQDGFVDTHPGGLGGKSAQAAEKQGVVKTPEGERVGTTSGDYSPQALGPAPQFLQGGRVSIRPGQGDISPYNPQNQLSPEQIQQLYSQPQFQGRQQGFPQLSQFSPQQQSAGGPGQIPQQFLEQNPQFLGQPGGAFPSQQGGPSQFGQQFSPQFQGGGGIPQGYPQQFGGLGPAGPGPAPQPQQFQFSPQSGQGQQGISPQFLGASRGQQDIPSQYLQQGPQGQGPQPQFSRGQGQSPSGSPLQSPGFPFDFSPYQAGPGGAPSAIPVQPGTQARFPGAGQGQQAFFPGGQPSFGGQGFPGGVPLSGQQIPQQFVPQNFGTRSGTPYEGAPSSKESGEGAKTS